MVRDSIDTRKSFILRNLCDYIWNYTICKPRYTPVDYDCTEFRGGICVNYANTVARGITHSDYCAGILNICYAKPFKLEPFLSIVFEIVFI